MKIKEYMEKYHLTYRALAEKIDVSPSTIFHFLSGRNKSLSAGTMEKIVSGTSNEITLEDLMEEIYQAQK